MTCTAGGPGTGVFSLCTHPSNGQRVGTLLHSSAACSPLIEACWGSFVWKPNKHHSHMCPLWLDGITEPTGQHVGSFHSGGGSSTERAVNGCQLQMLSHCTAQKGKAVDLTARTTERAWHRICPYLVD